MKLRVAFYCRSNLTKFFGGDTVQILKTKEAVEKRGVHVELIHEAPESGKFDIVHLFNPTYKLVDGAKKIKKSGTPLAVSTIYWNMVEYYNSLLGLGFKMLRHGIMAGFNVILRHFLYRYGWEPYSHGAIQKIFDQADVLLPNSIVEANHVRKHFKITHQKIVPTVNAVDSSFAKAKSNSFVKKYGVKDFVLYAGRLEPRKNAHLVIEAMRGSKIPLVMIGKLDVFPGYYDLCKKLADKNVIFIDKLPQEELASAYAAAKVHCLPSWYETPGLSNLEAGVAGCNLVMTNLGSVKEYFGKYAFYCEPNAASIRKAIDKALAAKYNPKLKEYLLKKFSWDETAKQTIAAYKSIL